MPFVRAEEEVEEVSNLPPNLVEAWLALPAILTHLFCPLLEHQRLLAKVLILLAMGLVVPSLLSPMVMVLVTSTMALTWVKPLSQPPV